MRNGLESVCHRPILPRTATLWQHEVVTLDRLLASVDVRVEPFALCLLNAGWRLRLPGRADVTLHFVLQGSGVLRGPQGETHSLERSWLAMVPQGTPHALECGTKVRSERAVEAAPASDGIVRLVAGSKDSADLQVACGAVHVTCGDSLSLFRHLREVVVADLSGHPQVFAAFEGILAEQIGASPGSDALTAAFMTQCLVYLLRHLFQQPDCPLPWLSALQDPSLAKAMDLIFENPAAAHTVGSLADEASMSRSVFAERFQAAFGCTPMTFLRDIRMRRAARLLERSDYLSIDQVAHRAGFSSRSHFSQAFRTHFGVSPATYRAAALW